MTYGTLNTHRSWGALIKDPAQEFYKWGVKDYLLPTYQQSVDRSSVKVKFAVHGTWTEAECARFNDGRSNAPQSNLCAILKAVQATRLADQRGIGQLLADVAKAAALADPDDPYAILGVDRAATVLELRNAYRDRAKQTHPDTGGSDIEFIRVKKAAQQLGVA